MPKGEKFEILTRGSCGFQSCTNDWGLVGMFGTSIRLIVSIAACVTNAASLHAADISRGLGLGEVVLEGTIEPGDFDKLQSLIEENGVRTIYLASPGGNVEEAMKIGRLVRTSKLQTTVPINATSDIRQKLISRHKLKDPKSNYMCASACFFVFVAGVKRTTDFDFDGDAILGIHRPYLPESSLKGMSGDQAIAAANQFSAVVKNYLNEMGVRAKYADLMFSVPKDQVRWIDNADFNADFVGLIPELKDWMDAQCDKRTDVEKAAWEGLKNKNGTQQTAAEKIIVQLLMKKMSELDNCESGALSGLAHKAWLKMFYEPR
jgi:hypothetical protein